MSLFRGEVDGGWWCVSIFKVKKQPARAQYLTTAHINHKTSYYATPRCVNAQYAHTHTHTHTLHTHPTPHQPTLEFSTPIEAGIPIPTPKLLNLCVAASTSTAFRAKSS